MGDEVVAETIIVGESGKTERIVYYKRDRVSAIDSCDISIAAATLRE
jgi:hypothetical protein